MNEKTYQLKLTDVTCASCVAIIESALMKSESVTSATISFSEKTLSITGSITPEATIKIISDVGYTAVIPSLDDEADAARQIRKLLLKIFIAGIVGLSLLALSWSPWMPMLTTVLGKTFWIVTGGIVLLIMIYSGGHFYRGAWKALRHGYATMDTLIALGTGAAWIYSMIIVIFSQHFPQAGHYIYFEAALIIIALVGLGNVLEMRAQSNTSEAINKLVQLQPKTAIVMVDGKPQQMPIEQIKTDAIIRIKPGDKIPVDGVVIEGESMVDEAMITGEPMPVLKKTNDEVVAGTINKTGSFLFKATRVGSGTVLAQIINLVKNAQGTKPPITKLTDKIAGIFVPVVVMIAIITALVWFFAGGPANLILITAMSVLVIACPCALGLAAPISVMIGIGKSAEKGVLIRNAKALQSASDLTTVVFDKTGTITKGEPAVVAMQSFNGFNESQILQYAASAEQGSEHPIAQAILNAAKAKALSLFKLERFNTESGFGITAEIEGGRILLGNERLLKKNKVALSEVNSFSNNAQTPIFLSVNQQLVGIIFIADPIKADAKQVIQSLKQLNIKTIMLTGDCEATAQAVAQAVGVDEVFAELLPEDKINMIKQLQAEKQKVAMIGDGINDAPALTQADVGMAMGSGTDVAMESADVTLMRSSLGSVVDAIHLSKITMRNIKQNLAGAFIYNVLAIPLAAGVLYPFWGVLLNPIIAGAAMAASSLTVVMNAVRLKAIK